LVGVGEIVGVFEGVAVGAGISMLAPVVLHAKVWFSASSSKHGPTVGPPQLVAAKLTGAEPNASP
jgi:hypothetical protein